jgi:hypothetical protein
LLHSPSEQGTQIHLNLSCWEVCREAADACGALGLCLTSSFASSTFQLGLPVWSAWGLPPAAWAHCPHTQQCWIITSAQPRLTGDEESYPCLPGGRWPVGSVLAPTGLSSRCLQWFTDSITTFLFLASLPQSLPHSSLTFQISYCS